MTFCVVERIVTVIFGKLEFYTQNYFGRHSFLQLFLKIVLQDTKQSNGSFLLHF